MRKIVPWVLGVVGIGAVGMALWRLFGYRNVQKREGQDVAAAKAAGVPQGSYTATYAQALREEQVKAAADQAVPPRGTDQALQTWVDRVKSEYETAVAAVSNCGRFGKGAYPVARFNDAHIQTVYGALWAWRSFKAGTKPKPDNAWAELAAVREAVFANAFTVQCKKVVAGKEVVL